MLYKPLIFLLLLIISFSLSSQQRQIDSLKHEISLLKPNQQKLDVLNKLNTLMLYNGDKDNEIIKYNKLMIELAMKLSKPKIEHRAYKNIAKYYLKNEKYKLAENYALKSKELAIGKKFKEEYLESCTLLGRIYNHFDYFQKAIECYRKAIGLFNEMNEGQKKINLRNLNTVYANLAITYKNIHEDSLANVCYIKSLDIAKKVGDYNRISNFYATLGWSAVALENYQLAEKYFKRALQDSNKVDYKIYNIAAHHGLGYTYSQWGKYDKALHHDTIALAFFKKTNNHLYENILLRNLSEVYIKKGELDKALAYIHEADEKLKLLNNFKAFVDVKITQGEIYLKLKKYKIAQKYLYNIYDDKELLIKTGLRQKVKLFKNLSDLEKGLHHYDKSLYFSERYNRYLDSLHQRIIRGYADLETKYQNEVQQKKILNQEKELLSQKIEKQRLTYGLSLLGLLFLIAGSMAYRFYVRNTKRQKEITNLIKKIKVLDQQLFSSNELIKTLNDSEHLKGKNEKKAFNKYLMNKYGFSKPIIVDVWESIANGLSRHDFSKQFKFSENTVKAWRKELYQKLKTYEHSEDRYSDYKAVVAYYNNLMSYKNTLKLLSNKNQNS